MKLLKDGYNLLPDQVENAKGLCTKRRALLIDSTGSGKTYTVLYSFAYLFSKGLVDGMVVATPCNAYDKLVWRPEITKFTNFRSMDFADVAKRLGQGALIENVLRGVQIVYMKHTQFKTDYPTATAIFQYFKRPLALIDEAHYVRTGKSQSAAVASLCLAKAYAVWGITATDLSRDTMDLYNIVSHIYPGRLGSKWDYVNRFCVVREKVIGRNPNGTLRKAKQVTGFKDVKTLREALSDFLVIGTRTVEVNLHEVPYSLSASEREVYSKISNGFLLNADMDDLDWIKALLSRDEVQESSVRSIKSVERHSSRYIYLQGVVDGSLNKDGSFGLNPSSKSQALLDLCNSIASKGQSALIYFDYYTSLDNVMYQLKTSGIKNPQGRPIKLLETSARKVQKPGYITKGMCDLDSYFVLVSRAASESDNYPFINHVIFYNIPTTPITYLQFLGRITRRNTLYSGDLHVHYLCSDNIDLYKLQVIGNKMSLMQATTYDLSSSFPQEHLKSFDDAQHLDYIKRHLLWKSH